jgi:hypothetical protein
MITFQRPSIEQRKFEAFVADHKSGKHKGQRLGQAFYNEFALHKVSDQTQLKGLYEADGTVAVALINQMFSFN